MEKKEKSNQNVFKICGVDSCIHSKILKYNKYESVNLKKKKIKQERVNFKNLAMVQL